MDHNSRVKATSETMPPYRVVILGAGLSVRGRLPSAIASINQHGCVLDWLLAAFSVLRSPEVYFVGGYGADAVMERYGDIRFLLNRDWEVTGPARSLSLAPLSSTRATYISYADVVYRPEIIRRMEAVEGEIVVAIDTRWRVRYEGRTEAELGGAEKVICHGERVVDIGKDIEASSASAEFAGVLKLSGRAACRLGERIAAGEFREAVAVPEIIRQLIQDGVNVVALDVNGEWAELNASQDLARFVLGTKAESLERLKPLIRTGHIGEPVSFTHEQWDADHLAVLQRVKEVFGNNPVIVRSSAAFEDGWTQSSAGTYQSVANIPAEDTDALVKAVERVLRSYGSPRGENQVLVQKMLQGARLSGVVMTRTLTLGAPYYVINYDDATARTDTVTAGRSPSVRTLFLHRGAALPSSCPQSLHAVLTVVQELETLVGHDSLDIEFAVTANGRVHVLQVRPIAVARPDQPVDDGKIAQGLEDAKRFFRRLQRPSPWLVGRSTQLSVMSDWNPAEIIGRKPNRLAFSLYRYLITDEVWALQRAQYGYRDVRPCNLLVDILGHPYVDVRAAFNSFIPASLPEDLATRLAEHCLGRLARHPELHDKVEFDVLLTCLSFDFEQKAARLRAVGFTRQEVDLLRESLREITRNAVTRCPQDIAALEHAEHRYSRIQEGKFFDLDRAFLLLEDARLHSIPRFAHLARGAFVAVNFLRSLSAVGITTERQTDDFLASVRTVSSAIRQDAALVARGGMTWEAFVERYGHLRPGTYDITSPHYASQPEEFLRPIVEAARNDGSERARGADPWDAKTRRAIDRALEVLDLGVDVQEFEVFVRTAIEGRESGKFIFTKNLSAALEAISAFAAAHGISREELAHIRIADLFALRSAGSEDVGRTLRSLAAAGRAASYVTQATCLPEQVFSEDDFVCFEQCKAVPNFVTHKRVRALIDSRVKKAGGGVDLTGKIAVAPNADPGFDWIFSKNIVGLVTMYGGANSHMAIRAAEFQLPAAIGVGERLYEEIGGARMIDLDCGRHQIRTIP